jgi:hypothetical protein
MTTKHNIPGGLPWGAYGTIIGRIQNLRDAALVIQEVPLNGSGFDDIRKQIEAWAAGLFLEIGRLLPLPEGLKATPEQRDVIGKLRARAMIERNSMGEPQPELGGGAVMIEERYKSGGSIWLGIEPDGYTHS